MTALSTFCLPDEQLSTWSGEHQALGQDVCTCDVQSAAIAERLLLLLLLLLPLKSGEKKAKQQVDIIHCGGGGKINRKPPVDSACYSVALLESEPKKVLVWGG